MTEIITFPDVEAAVQDYLTGELAALSDTAAVVNEIPATRPARMVRVVRTGGPRLDLIRDQAQVTVDCWDKRIDGAHDLGQLCRGLIGAMRYRYGAVNVYRSDELGFSRLVDPDTGSPFYRLNVHITVRGSAL